MALSPPEAEYIALSEVVKVTLNIRRFINELSLQAVTANTIIFCDKQYAQKLVRRRVNPSNTKHVDIHYYFVGEVNYSGEIEVS